MKKSILVIILLFFSGLAFSQTTVTLQDQCNCEVLSGTAVTTPGAVAPGGADTGDIYVNTNTGTIFYWDGDSWELTATDDQQLTGFTFNGVTNQLTLSLENGGSINVDLSSLSDTLTDTNTTITNFEIDGTNTNLVITDSDTNSFSVALADIAALVNTDSQNAAQVPYTDNAGLGETNVQDAIDALATQIDDDITGATLNASSVLTISEGTTDVTVNLSALEESADIAANAADIATNTADIATNTADIATNTADIATNAAAIALKEDSANKSNDGTLAGNSATDFPTEQAVKTYVDNQVGAITTDDDVSITNTVTGNRIATIDEDGITAVDINETVTSLSQNTATGVISYTDEDGGTPETANVVSASNADNELIVGADGGASFELTDIDVDGDSTDETTVQEVVDAIAPITSKAARIFYPPSIAVPASSTGPGTPIDLHAQYVAQYGSPAVKSPSAPNSIPTYAAGELHYYITFYDTSVFSGVSVSDAGIMTFTVDAVPTGYNSLINVVFVVK